MSETTAPPPSDTSRESAFLDEMHARAMLFVKGGAAGAVIGAFVLAAHILGHAGVVVGFVGVIGGPIYVGIGASWLRMLPAARAALSEPPRDARLEAVVLKGGYGIGRFTRAQLWPADGYERALAKFSESVHWQTPRLLRVNRVPARVFGLPVRGAAVVVSCEEGIVAGRIRRSRVKESELSFSRSRL